MKKKRPRSRLTRTAQGIKLVIPFRKESEFNFFTLFWLICWAGGALSLLGLLLRHMVKRGSTALPVSIFYLVFLGLWAFVGILTIRYFLGDLFGKEIIKISPGGITITHQNILSRSQHFDVREIADLRLAPERLAEGGAFLFESGGETICFGMNLDYAEAKFLATRISEIMKVKYVELSTEEEKSIWRWYGTFDR